MLRSSSDQEIAEPLFTLETIASGAWDADLRAWGEAARAFGTALIVEWGTEMNGRWFSWNGVWNGGAEARAASFSRGVPACRRRHSRAGRRQYHLGLSPERR